MSGRSVTLGPGSRWLFLCACNALFLRVGHRHSGKVYLCFCKQFLETSFLFGIGAFIIDLL